MSEADEKATRRDVLKSAAVGGALVGLCAHGFACARSLVPNVLYEPPLRRTLGSPERFPEGATYLAEEKIFVVREAGLIRALSAVCTHLGCTVGTSDSGYHCPCHGSTFAADGAATGGPAPRGLPWHPVELAGSGALVVDLGKEVAADVGLRLEPGPDPKNADPKNADPKGGEPK
jgi:cytochrome b6-f complex iron-sulfur subunit